MDSVDWNAGMDWTMDVCIATPSDRNFSFIVGVVRSQTKRSSEAHDRSQTCRDRLALG